MAILLLSLGLSSCMKDDDDDSASGDALPTEDLSTLMPSDVNICGTLLTGKDDCRTMIFPKGSQIQRSYWVHKPSSLADNPPLLIALHGVTSTAERNEFVLQSRKLADDRKYMLVLANGYDLTGNGYGFWNTAKECLLKKFILDNKDPIATKVCEKLDQINDVNLLSTIIDNMTVTHKIDRQRVYLLGHSNGGILSHFTACNLAKKITAIVSLAGTLEEDTSQCVPSRPISVMQIHGTADKTVNYNGGLPVSFLVLDVLKKIIANATGLVDPELDAAGNTYLNSFPKLASAEATVARWVAFNQCNATPSASAPFLMTTADSFVDPVKTLADRTAVQYSYSDCKRPVAFVPIEGGTHVPSFKIEAFHKTVGDFLDAAPAQ